jgi:hypothetical protein
MIFYSDNAEILIPLTDVVNSRILVALSGFVCEGEWEGIGLRFSLNVSALRNILGVEYELSGVMVLNVWKLCSCDSECSILITASKRLLILPHFMHHAVPRMAFHSANTDLEVDEIQRRS